MTETAKVPTGGNAPYKCVKKDGKWTVQNNIGEVKGTYPGTPAGYADAIKLQRALYASVDGAGDRAAKVKFTGEARRRGPAPEKSVEQAANDPVDKKLWASCVSAAKAKFQVYPSAYANGWAVQEYKRRGGKWREKAAEDLVPEGWGGWESASKDEGLGKWFAEKWVDISRTNPDGSHPACGRPTAGMSSSDYSEKYPKCVPASKAAKMSDSDKKSAVDRKRDAPNASGSGKGQAPKMVSTEKSKGPSATAADKDPKGGLSAAGRKKFHVKPGVRSYATASDADKKRWIAWANRFTKTPQPLTDDKGEPTRYALMFTAWGMSIPKSTADVAKVHALAVSRGKTMNGTEKADTDVSDELLAWDREVALTLHERMKKHHSTRHIVSHAYTTGYGGLCLSCGHPAQSPVHTDDHDGDDADTPAAGGGAAAPAGGGVATAAYTGAGSMVALYPDKGGLSGISTQGDLPLESNEDMHVTLAYLPTTPSEQDMPKLISLVSTFAAQHPVMDGVWGGTARFNPSAGSDGKPVLVALPDLPALPDFREQLCAWLDTNGFEVSDSHGYTPHLTIAYDDNGRVRANGPVSFSQVTIKTPNGRYDFPLTGDPDAAGMDPDSDKMADTTGELAALTATEKEMYDQENIHITKNLMNPMAPHKMIPAKFTSPTGKPRCAVCGHTADSSGGLAGGLHISSKPDVTGPKLLTEVGPKDLKEIAGATTLDRQYVEPENDTPMVKAFVTDIGGKTLITGPASLFTPNWETALTPNSHMMWMQGRFVGAEKANRNGAFWSTSDLNSGEATVKHGPLNWLHEARHVIGTIADAKVIHPSEKAASNGDVPHIAAVAGIWKWLYPQEAAVIEQASDQGKLWYSMECVSREVQCMGDNGCGNTYTYGDMLKGKACQHIAEKSSTRRFVDPTFLGAAALVPPVNPGWAEAHANVIRQAASYAETAFEQAGQPDMSASEWELLISQVVAYANGAAR